MSGPLIVTVSDVRKAGYCVAGARSWFNLHSLDFDSFLKHGIPAEDLPAEDSMAQAAILRAQARTTGQTNG